MIALLSWNYRYEACWYTKKKKKGWHRDCMDRKNIQSWCLYSWGPFGSCLLWGFSQSTSLMLRVAGGVLGYFNIEVAESYSWGNCFLNFKSRNLWLFNEQFYIGDIIPLYFFSLFPFGENRLHLLNMWACDLTLSMWELV